MKSNTHLRRSRLALACLLALGGTGAFAQAPTEREAALEARVAQLEQMVQQLLADRQAALEAPATSASKPANPIQETSVVPGSAAGTRFSFGGFIKVNGTYSDFSDGNPAAGSVARDFNLPGAIPVGGRGESAVFDGHAKYSRILLGTDTTLDNGKTLSSRIELDFGVLGGGDERSTNRYIPSLRRGFVTYGNWLVGQEWSNFMELANLPETTDFVGPTEGLVFVRQAQLRYTSGPWSVALENPETTFRPFGGGGRQFTDDNSVPDLSLRYRHSASWGLFSIAGLVRQLKHQSGGVSESGSGFGVSLSGKLLFGEDDLRFQATAGKGIGRYIGINLFDDALLDASGNLDELEVFAASASYRHVWGGSWRSNFAVGYAQADNDALLSGPSGAAEAASVRANLFWSPASKLDVGIEFSTARLGLENGTSGTANRIDLMVKHSF